MGDKESNKTLSVQLNEYFKHNIKLSFVSILHKFNVSVIIVTNDDKVYEFRDYGFKRIQYSVLLIGNNEEKMKTIIDNSIVDELCYKQVIHFKNSDCHVIARTSDGKVYCWGLNKKGCLGNGKDDYKPYKPKLNQYLRKKQIIDICCGDCHTIVLTISGEVYSWGWNGSGQIGIGSDEDVVSIPQQLKDCFNGEKVKAISCGSSHSLALTDGGRVFSWGDNQYKQLCVSYTSMKKSNKPILIEMNEIIIEKISCGQTHNLLLSREGEIYVFGNNDLGRLGTDDKETQINPKKLNINNKKFCNISTHSLYDISVAFSVNGLYYIWGKCGEQVITEPTIETKFNSFEEIFENYLKVNFKPIENRIIEFDYYFVNNGKYERDFKQIEELGKGSYGQVFKVETLKKYLFKQRFFAIKEIKFRAENEKEYLNELVTSPIVSKLSIKNIMKYYDIWLQNNFTLENENKIYSNNYILYIQMELCDKTLEDFIDEIKNDSNLYSNEMLTELGYYISIEIFIQILNGVNYLHKQNKPIIHRDLRPDNIMLKIDKKSKSIVKIADLGLAKLHELNQMNIKHTQDRGNIKYMAPEVENSGDYDTRADIFSLGLVLEDMFDINVNRNYQNVGNISALMSTKYHNLSDLCNKMTQQCVSKRCQTIEEILNNDKHLFVLSSQEFNPNEELERVLNQNNNKSYVYKLTKHILNETNSGDDDSSTSGDYETEDSDAYSSYYSDSDSSDTDNISGDEEDDAQSSNIKRRRY